MKRHCGWVILGVVCAWTAVTPSAQAAKGVKKNGEHQHRGTVVAVHQKAGQASFTIKVHHHHKKKAATTTTTTAAPTKAHHHKHLTFHVTSATRFEAVSKQGHTAVSGAALHKGEHVKVMAKNHVADKVEIIAHHKKKT